MWAVYYNDKYQYTTFETNPAKALQYIINDIEENELPEDTISIGIKWRESHGTGTTTQGC